MSCRSEVPELGSAVGRRSLLLWGALALACKGKQELPDLGALQAFSLTNQAGDKVSLESFQGQVWIAAFLFTRCPTVCPRIARRLRRLQDLSKDKSPALRFVAFSVDPEFDTPQVLSAYGKSHGADFKRWSFLTGDSSMIQKTVTESFKVGLEGKIDESKEHLGITHGSHLVLVDQRGHLRGYYRTSEESEMQRVLLDGAGLVDDG